MFTTLKGLCRALKRLKGLCGPFKGFWRVYIFPFKPVKWMVCIMYIIHICIYIYMCRQRFICIWATEISWNTKHQNTAYMSGNTMLEKLLNHVLTTNTLYNRATRYNHIKLYCNITFIQTLIEKYWTRIKTETRTVCKHVTTWQNQFSHCSHICSKVDTGESHTRENIMFCFCHNLAPRFRI